MSDPARPLGEFEVFGVKHTMCPASEWHRDGRGLWAMRACQYYTGPHERHAFGPWKYNVQPREDVTQ